MVTKVSAPGRSFGGVADYCLHDRWVPGQGHPESAERVEWTETRNLATERGRAGGRGSWQPRRRRPRSSNAWQGVAATGRKLEKPVCHYSLSWAKEEKPDRQEMLPGGGGEPEGAGDGEAPGADRVSPGRATARACDREPGGSGEREVGGVEPEQATPLEVGGKVRAGAGEAPVPGAGEEQQATGGGGAGRGWARAFGRPLAGGSG